MTINEAMVWMQTMKERHAELVQLRNENSATTKRFVGHTDKEIIREPLYDAKQLDVLVMKLAQEIRMLSLAIKTTNGVTPVLGYTPNDDVLRPIA